MGVPVSGKNLFPSNIAGQPTWFLIRASKNGYVARKRDSEILVAMNPETAKVDAQSLPPGGVVIYEESLDRASIWSSRATTFHFIPCLRQDHATICPEVKLRKLVRNMVYVGVVAQLLAIDLGVVESSLHQQFSKKQKVFDMNFGAVKRASTMPENLTKRDPFFIERMNKTEGKIIIEGNAACGMGAVFAGVTVIAWYPITPPLRWLRPPQHSSRSCALRRKARLPLP